VAQGIVGKLPWYSLPMLLALDNLVANWLRGPDYQRDSITSPGLVVVSDLVIGCQLVSKIYWQRQLVGILDRSPLTALCSLSFA